MKGKMGTELWLLFGISLVWMLGTSHGNLVMDALAGNASITGGSINQSTASNPVTNPNPQNVQPGNTKQAQNLPPSLKRIYG